MNYSVSYFVKNDVRDLARAYRLRRDPDCIGPLMPVGVIAIPACRVVGSKRAVT